MAALNLTALNRREVLQLGIACGVGAGLGEECVFLSVDRSRRRFCGCSGKAAGADTDVLDLGSQY